VTDSAKVGKVVSQNPAANTQIPGGTTVTIVLGSAPQNVSVPSEIGKQYTDARNDLINSGFKVRKQTQASSQPANQVIDMNPEANTQVAPGTTVTLIISDGSQAQITMPSITGLTVSQAQQQLANLGWTGTFSQNTATTLDPNKDGTIKSQTPGQGTPITKNSTVSITVYQLMGGPPTT
jgi:serine/threonine-protein kinase